MYHQNKIRSNDTRITTLMEHITRVEKKNRDMEQEMKRLKRLIAKLVSPEEFLAAGFSPVFPSSRFQESLQESFKTPREMPGNGVRRARKARKVLKTRKKTCGTGATKIQIRLSRMHVGRCL